MSEANTKPVTTQEIHIGEDVYVIEDYTVTYDRCSRGRGAGRRHSFTHYSVRKNGKVIASGLTRRQAETHRRAIERSRPAADTSPATGEPLLLPSAAVTRPFTSEGN